MKNNKGFTVIELAVSFVLVSAISVMLLQLVLSLKELYVSGDIKTTLLNKQGIMTKKIYDDLNTKTLTKITSCGLSCLTFTYNDGTVSNLLVDPGNNTITYHDYTMKLSDGSKFGQLSTEVIETGSDFTESPDSVLKISIPITNRLLGNDDFGIYIVQTYNRGQVTNINTRLPLSKATVTASGVPLKIGVTDDNHKWIRIFHQESGTSFSNKEEFLKSKESKKQSSLTSLEAFKTTLNLKEIINEQENEIKSTSSSDKDKEKAIREMKENYQNGYYYLLLDYPGVTGVELQNYNEWYQTNNFTKINKLEGAYYVGLGYNSNTSCRFIGFQYNKNIDTNHSYVNGCQGESFTLGSTNGTINKDTGTTTSVDLWVNADEYISKYALSTLDYTS